MADYEYFVAIDGKLYQVERGGFIGDGDFALTKDGHVGKVEAKELINVDVVKFFENVGVKLEGTVVGRVSYFGKTES